MFSGRPPACIVSALEDLHHRLVELLGIVVNELETRMREIHPSCSMKGGGCAAFALHCAATAAPLIDVDILIYFPIG